MADQSLRAAYLEDWLDTIEALPVEVQRNFSLIRELDAMSQDVIREVQASCTEFMATAKDVSLEDRKRLLQRLTDAFQKSLKHGEAKVTLAVQTYDMFDKHIRRLDEDLQKFEDELLMTGPKVSAGNAHAGGKKQHLQERMTDSPAKRRKMKEGSGANAGKKESKKERRPPVALMEPAESVGNRIRTLPAEPFPSTAVAAMEDHTQSKVPLPQQRKKV